MSAEMQFRDRSQGLERNDLFDHASRNEFRKKHEDATTEKGGTRHDKENLKNGRGDVANDVGDGRWVMSKLKKKWGSGEKGSLRIKSGEMVLDAKSIAEPI